MPSKGSGGPLKVRFVDWARIKAERFEVCAIQMKICYIERVKIKVERFDMLTT